MKLLQQKHTRLDNTILFIIMWYSITGEWVKICGTQLLGSGVKICGTQLLGSGVKTRPGEFFDLKNGNA